MLNTAIYYYYCYKGADIGGMTTTAFSIALDRKLVQVTEQAINTTNSSINSSNQTGIYT